MSGNIGEQPLRCVAWAPQSYFVVLLELVVLVLVVVRVGEVW